TGSSIPGRVGASRHRARARGLPAVRVPPPPCVRAQAVWRSGLARGSRLLLKGRFRRSAIAKQLLALIPCPHRAVLGHRRERQTLPRPNGCRPQLRHLRMALSARRSSTRRTAAPRVTPQTLIARFPALRGFAGRSVGSCLPPTSASEMAGISLSCLRYRGGGPGNPSICRTAPVAQSPWHVGRIPVLAGGVGTRRRPEKNGPARTRTWDQPIMSRRL